MKGNKIQYAGDDHGLPVPMGRHGFGQGMKVYLVIGSALSLMILDTLGYI